MRKHSDDKGLGVSAITPPVSYGLASLGSASQEPGPTATSRAEEEDAPSPQTAKEYRDALRFVAMNFRDVRIGRLRLVILHTPDRWVICVDESPRYSKRMRGPSTGRRAAIRTARHWVRQQFPKKKPKMKRAAK